MCQILMDSNKVALWLQVRGDISKDGQHSNDCWNRMDDWEGLWKVRRVYKSDGNKTLKNNYIEL